MWEFKDQGGITNQELYTIPSAVPDSFSPDGSKLAGYISNSLKIWDAATGRELLTLVGHKDWIMGLAFSPDGKSLASTSMDGSVKIWSLGPGNESTAITSPVTGFGTRVVYAPIGKQFLTNGGDGTGIVWNDETGSPDLIVHGNMGEVLNVAFRSDGKLFATGGMDGNVILWDAINGRKVLSFPGHENGVRDLAFSPDGKLLAAGGADNVARVWSVDENKLAGEMKGHNDWILGASFSPAGIPAGPDQKPGLAQMDCRSKFPVTTGTSLCRQDGASGSGSFCLKN